MDNTLRREASMDETNANTRALIPFIPCSSNLAVYNSDLEGVAEAGPLLTLLDLPFELLSSIFQWLDHAEIAKCARVCKRFNEVSKDPQLFRKIEILPKSSEGYAEWILNRTTNPKKMYACEEKCSRLISAKLSTWSMLRELRLEFVNLRDVGEGSMENLRTLSIYRCSFNWKTFWKLMHQSKNIRRIFLMHNYCSQCGMGGQLGYLPLMYFEVLGNSIEEVYLHNNTVDIEQQDLNQPSACVNRKKPSLFELCNDVTQKATLAMEMAARKCLKLKSVTFWELDIITDDVLGILFENCTNLKEVYLIKLPKITEKSCLMAINVLPQLRRIFIWHCNLVPKSSKNNLRVAIAKLNTKTPPFLSFLS